MNLSHQLIEISSPFPFSLLSQVYVLGLLYALRLGTFDSFFECLCVLSLSFVYLLWCVWVCFPDFLFSLTAFFFSSAFFANNVLLDMLRNRYSRIDELEQEVMDRPKKVDEGMKLQNNLLV